MYARVSLFPIRPSPGARPCRITPAWGWHDARCMLHPPLQPRALLVRGRGAPLDSLAPRQARRQPATAAVCCNPLPLLLAAPPCAAPWSAAHPRHCERKPIKTGPRRPGLPQSTRTILDVLHLGLCSAARNHCCAAFAAGLTRAAAPPRLTTRETAVWLVELSTGQSTTSTFYYLPVFFAPCPPRFPSPS
ncbi:MAG: hypothetical protein J3K34DRAFT_434233 [Monoraphidium minutum]|nr:MAG: hypothetical protein J3K34DRAFT_434233 [Monoraphidium minutum]